MINSNDIFKRGSKTYYYSSIFFDKKTKNNVSKLYAFVRVADDFVDSSPSNKAEYLKFKKTYYDALQGKHLQKTKYSEIIIDFIVLSKEFNFQENWIDAFFKSMDFDLEKKVCKTRRDVDNYIHGSAEVIGLMMSRILKIEPGADEYSKKLGKAMQIINFIRDIKEDYSLNRLYIPDFYSKKLFKINQCLDKKNIELVKKIIRKEIIYYQKIQEDAEKGFKFIKYKHLIAIKTASDMYKYTSKKIYDNPMIVFKEKFKPSKIRIIFTGIKNIFLCIKY